ncbi:RNA polymerase sigma-70 factor (ECF subfamily) [Kitasatospora atroaurantiaca]|uniref:RNA polymerase sigma-70 factor (ECF subfamily) n=2 Tax=Kitasatospora atroaurantiaca TaxID=285545 RepID=A0A561EUT2_9ACTN|nr:RNA polymerase sigma factor SigE [Kitasatospora atroaurantiaca]TWE19341.1 RNA polymerase sigma-70 factor (ECF subfamily) [Kitasatospora atroaurantiaca]
MVVALLGRRADRGGVAEGDVPVLRQLRGTSSARTPKPVMNQPAHSPLDKSTAADTAMAEAPAALATFAEGPDAQTWTPPSWEEIVEAHSARVYRLAYRLTGNQHDAEDLTQEVFVRVFRSLSTYSPGTFEGWLHRITTNLFLDMVRRRQRIRFDALGEDAAERLPSREPSPAQHFSDTHFDADVQQALDTLAPEFRAAVVLCDIEGLSYEEIAATLGVKLGTVRSRIHRGRSHLRAALKHRAPGSAPGRVRRGGSTEPVAVAAQAAGGGAGPSGGSERGRS